MKSLVRGGVDRANVKSPYRRGLPVSTCRLYGPASLATPYWQAGTSSRRIKFCRIPAHRVVDPAPDQGSGSQTCPAFSSCGLEPGTNRVGIDDEVLKAFICKHRLTMLAEGFKYTGAQTTIMLGAAAWTQPLEQRLGEVS